MTWWQVKRWHSWLSYLTCSCIYWTGHTEWTGVCMIDLIGQNISGLLPVWTRDGIAIVSSWAHIKEDSYRMSATYCVLVLVQIISECFRVERLNGGHPLRERGDKHALWHIDTMIMYQWQIILIQPPHGHTILSNASIEECIGPCSLLYHVYLNLFPAHVRLVVSHIHTCVTMDMSHVDMCVTMESWDLLTPVTEVRGYDE